MSMLTYDQDAHQRLVKVYLHLYHRNTKKLTTGAEVFKDKYGNPIALIGFISVELKDDADILADLAKIPQVRVVS